MVDKKIISSKSFFLFEQNSVPSRAKDQRRATDKNKLRKTIDSFELRIENYKYPAADIRL